MAKAKHAATATRRKRDLITVATFIIIIAAVLVFLYRDELFSKSTGKAEVAVTGEPFTYENGSEQSFALLGEKLCISSSTGLQLLDEKGQTISRQVFSMSEPCVATGGSTCLFYDIGGAALRAFFGKDYTELDSESTVVAASVNTAGYVAAVTEESGYKGCVTVYDADGDAVYKWYSGTSYVLDAVVTPDCSRMIALCAGDAGSVVHFFRLTDEEPYANAEIPGELCYKLVCAENGSAYVLSSDSLRFFDKNGNQDDIYDFGESFLVDYEITDSLCCLALSRYVSGSEVTLLSFSSGGRKLGEASLSYNPSCLSSNGAKLLVFGSGALALYDKSMDLTATSGAVYGYKSALLLPSGEAMLLASYHGEKASLK